MAVAQESLFSLELVVEKLYLPYCTCRFPAVAFKLLDFPTILISHVETELAGSIKRKINIDPYYTVPNQFSELQDKHGNFMIKKGKSCLFKIAFQTLSLHLSNAPMYIMVIDEYPEVPKLLGNSSLALNETMDAIHKDIKTNGFTVPSVHGDKGLFKVYSLMGKEIGYVILGFRLLSLGPGLIAHLPATALVKRASESKKHVEQKSVVEEIIEVKKQAVHTAAAHTASIKTGSKETHRDHLNSTREIGLNTDVEKCDALMQTIDVMPETEGESKPKKSVKTIETQTERQIRQKVKRQIEELKFQREESDESDDGLLLNPNIICPPPMYFNSNAEPKVHIEHDMKPYYDNESTFEDITVEDLSGDEHFETMKPKHDNKIKYSNVPPTRMEQDIPRLHDAKTVVLSSVKSEEKNQPGIDLQQIAGSGPAFPLLTALLTELSKIQNPQFVNEAMNQVQQATSVRDSSLVGQAFDKSRTQPVKLPKTKVGEGLPSVKEVDEKEVNVSTKKKGKKSHKTCAGQPDGVPKQKGWIRKAPEAAVKKTKLVFGLTNTQRLRLAKQNPNWLKTAEQDEKVAKSQRQKPPMRTKELDADLETGNLSDTYTEVRRLAAAELAKSTMGQTALSAAGDDSKLKKMKKKSVKSRDNSPAKNKLNRTRSKSPKGKGKPRQKESVGRRDGYSGEEDKVMDLDPYARNIASPDLMKDERLDSAADSMPSSRIEVHIPSARAYESEEDETFSDSFEEVTPEQRKDTKSKFPGFHEGDETLPGSIAFDGNTSMNTTTEFDDDSPLESTRVSKQFRHEPVTGESLFKSTEDYNTNQFQSTDEPELQKLISDHEQTETLPTPVTDRSVRSPSPARSPSPGTLGAAGSNRLSMKFEVLNPKASQQSPLPAMRRSQQTLKIDSLNARPSPTSSRSSQGSPRNPTPRARKPLRERKLEFKKESIHTESVSSYMPSESENILSLISDGSYSDDFHMSSDKDASSRLSTPELPRLIPSTKLGFTIA